MGFNFNLGFKPIMMVYDTQTELVNRLRGFTLDGPELAG
jgi:hypothetical protein